MSLSLCCLLLVTPRLSQDIQYHVWPCSMVTNRQPDIKPQTEGAVSLVIADGHFWSSSGIYLDIYGLTYSLYHPEGKKKKKNS